LYFWKYPTKLHPFLRFSHETYFSTQQIASRAYSRFSCPNGNKKWSRHYLRSPRKRPIEANSVGWKHSVGADVLPRQDISISEPIVIASSRFPRHTKLLLPAEYNRVFAAGKRFSSACVTLVAARREFLPLGTKTTEAKISSTHARLGLAIAKKQIKRAHERNRVKRLIRECFRQNLQRLQGIELVAMAKTNAQKTLNPLLAIEIERLFVRAVDFYASAPITFVSAPTLTP
jgi:ribonuclease P protein component